MTDNSLSRQDKRRAQILTWKALVAEYQKPSTWRALWQIVDTIVPYVALWCLIYWSLSVSWWITFPLAALSGGFLIRIFIIFHDCGHGSFFKSQLANDTVGFLAGVLTFTPYYHWTWEHSVHHTNSGDLDRRGTGDIWTMTVQEYLESSRWKKFAYRLARNPFVLFVIAPNFVFLIRQRFPTPGAKERERASVQWMNLAILLMVVGLSWIFGLKNYLIIQLTMMGFGGAIGVWLFYVQHQFEGAYWERGDDWDYTAAALQGSSFYKLPKILQWFSGSIGFHHIHHLSPRIPNYNLERCHKADPFFQAVPAVTLFASFKALTFRLWDEPMKQLVGFGRLRELKREMKQRAADLANGSGLNSANVGLPIDGRVPSRVDSRSGSN